MLYAKSEKEESIKQHTDKLLENLKLLKNCYGTEILKNKKINKDRFFKILEIACMYHDTGKAYTPFQNMILEKLKKKEIPTKFDYKSIKHEQLSPLFIPYDKLNLNEDEKRLLIQTIFYHHERDECDINGDLVDMIIEEDIMPRIDEIQKELGIEINKEPDSYYLDYAKTRIRIKSGDKLYIEYCLLKGLLHRIDHSSSAGIKIEDDTEEWLQEFTENFMQCKNFKKNDLQKFSSDNQEKNLLIIGSTGMGKTEAALLWSGNSKTFFTLPIRISINAIFDRINEQIGYKHVGLLHSTALDYLEKKEEFENQYNIYEESKNLASKVTTCTIDQIFTFVFKYKGYEKMYSTLSYSKVIIDEIQAYSPEIVAVILKGLQMINDIGGRFMIMTATLPRIYKEELEKMGIQVEYKNFLKESKRHLIKIKNNEIVNDLDNICEKTEKENKTLIIVNTINKAIEIYTKLKQKGIKNVHLLHSRFILKDRNKKEEEIKEFSKNRE